uniref:protein disulfide-isomerase A3-like n=1 Tax=Styela clava TaxID=7725 RepID=UPI0019393CD3|nr:protein disulfide-isomerase A3-like [Styela clava]
MKLLGIFACLVAVAMGSDVIELTDNDFKNKIGTYDIALVEFFAPWCGHCKRLAPEYEKAATALKSDKSSAVLIKVDCTANTGTCGEYGVSGYPTLKIFQGGKMASDYSGPREADGIVKHMKKASQPATTDLKDVEAFEKFKTGDSGVLIGFFSSADDDDFKAFSSASSALRDHYTFGHSFNADVSKKAGFKGGDVVYYRAQHMISKFEEAVVKMDGKVETETIRSFLKKNYNGLCGHLTPDNADSFKKPLLTAFYNVDYKKNVKGTNYWRNRVMKFGANDKDITLSVASVDDFGQLLTDVGLQDKFSEKPVVMIRDDKDKKYIMEEEFSTDNLKAFVKAYIDGKLTAKIKSEPVPESQDGPVTVVVGESFDQIVNDQNKDVLIEFYAPWCGHCKSLAPKFDELGEKLKAVDDLVIAKMDATANEVPSNYQVSGFPTIYWAPKDNKENPVKYNGGREVQNFVDYIKQHSSSEKLKKTEL